MTIMAFALDRTGIAPAYAKANAMIGGRTVAVRRDRSLKVGMPTISVPG